MFPKKLSFTVFGLCLSFVTFGVIASIPIKVKGNEAKEVLNLLQSSGAFLDCGMGTCGTEAKDIECTASHFDQDVINYSLLAQGETGDITKEITLDGDNAKTLYDFFSLHNINNECINTSCKINVSNLICTVHEHSQVYECSINP